MEFWDEHRTIVSRYADGEDLFGFRYIQYYVAHRNNKIMRTLTLYINPNYTKGSEENEYTRATMSNEETSLFQSNLIIENLGGLLLPFHY
ncbi:hypothetical protein LAV72_18410 [Lysinibacillus xylanilyticus]|uniref:hypothetical protein n=1 Tax=Lysinibacillus TaxID=400634 RepID=UPI002B24B8D2|nr:hypothetical protein [Lysinibacillus xylanilyticus]MEB2301580.1 hypothetical protein [Lysinibacillus xylanilyticus]